MVYDIYHKRDSSGEMNDLPSMTVPDQSLPLAKLLERAQRGQLDVANYFRSPEYDSNIDSFNDVPERPLDRMDALDQLSRISPAAVAPAPMTQEEKQEPSEAGAASTAVE